MSYSYDIERPKLFTKAGEELVEAVRTQANVLLDFAGAFRTIELLKTVTINRAFGTFEFLACLDLLIEKKELVAVTEEQQVKAQFMIYTRA